MCVYMFSILFFLPTSYLTIGVGWAFARVYDSSLGKRRVWVFIRTAYRKYSDISICGDILNEHSCSHGFHSQSLHFPKGVQALHPEALSPIRTVRESSQVWGMEVRVLHAVLFHPIQSLVLPVWCHEGASSWLLSGQLGHLFAQLLLVVLGKSHLGDHRRRLHLR